jgi:hypothetical protein
VLSEDWPNSTREVAEFGHRCASLKPAACLRHCCTATALLNSFRPCHIVGASNGSALLPCPANQSRAEGSKGDQVTQIRGVLTGAAAQGSPTE